MSADDVAAPRTRSAKPTAQHTIAAIEKFARIFATTVPAFLPREKPISRNAKPACMNITSRAATSTQIALIASSAAARRSTGGLERVGRAPPPGAAAAPATRRTGPASAQSLDVIGPPRSGFTSGVCGASGPGVFGPRVESSPSGVSPSGRRSVHDGRNAPCAMFVHDGHARAHAGATSAGRARSPSRRTLDPWPRPRSQNVNAAQWSPNGGALGAVRPDPARRQRLRRERLLPRRPAPAAAQGRLQGAAGDARGGRGARRRRSPTPSRRR